MADVVIRVEDVSKSFKLPHEKQSSIKGLFINLFKGKRSFEKQQVLKNISFEIEEGDFFGIVGRNGSGKSTLLKLLAGIYAPDKGQIHIRGKLTPFIELGVGFNPELTGRENVFLNGALLGFSRSEVRQMYDEIVEFAELKKFMDQKLKNYSSGMQVRLAFSIAIKAQSDVLLLDEVLAVGDAAFQQKCFTYFRQLKAMGKTVIFVSHDMNTVNEYCNKALLLESGRIKIIGETDDITNQYLLDNSKKQKETIMSTDGERAGEFVSSDAKVSLKITDKIKIYNRTNIIRFSIKYHLLTDRRVVIGFSIRRDGSSIAEMNSLSTAIPSITGDHKVYFSASLNNFLPGVYTVNVALLTNSKNPRMVAYQNHCDSFVVRPSMDDRQYGGIFRVDGTWTVIKDR